MLNQKQQHSLQQPLEEQLEQQQPLRSPSLAWKKLNRNWIVNIPNPNIYQNCSDINDNVKFNNNNNNIQIKIMVMIKSNNNNIQLIIK